jgi:hypothetical protein
VPSKKVCSRKLYYEILVQAGRPLTTSEIMEAVEVECEGLGIPVFKLGTTKRVMGSLINDGLVSVTPSGLSGSLVGDTRPRVLYQAVKGVEKLQERLYEPQTVRVVSDIAGYKTVSSYNSTKSKRITAPSRTYYKVPGYTVEPKPRQRVNRLIEDGSWENKTIDWINEDGVPLRRWRWKDQRDLEAERNRRSKSKANTA